MLSASGLANGRVERPEWRLITISIFLDRDLRNLAQRLLEIEGEINRRVGENLFSWESRFGVHQMGYDIRVSSKLSVKLHPSVTSLENDLIDCF